MIVLFGASTDIGLKLARKLRETGLQVRPISRRGISGTLSADLATGRGVSEVLAGSSVIVSCVHARHTKALLEYAPDSVEKLVCIGSAWRYSAVPNKRADEVRQAEKLFVSSGRNGAMLHPTMIYGGNQERNIKRLLRAIKKMPFIPAPGGGSQIVQPIYIDDVVASLFAAVRTNWNGPNVIPLAGPPIQWRDMVADCAAAINCRRSIVSMPLWPALLTLIALNRFGISSIDANIVRRFREDVNISLSSMQDMLTVVPRNFRAGIALAVENWRQSDVPIPKQKVQALALRHYRILWP
jgi:uncharacterized protein YbjT (DUF2867 family)